jgi:hypothetical protein
MDAWKSYVYSILVCLFCCAIVSQMVQDGRRKSLLQFLCGTAVAITVLRPLTGLDLTQFLAISDLEIFAADAYVAEGEATAGKERGLRIKQTCEAYILDKAKAMGADIQPEVQIDEDWLPVSVRIQGSMDPQIQKQLEHILIRDMGITKENQQWTGNPENGN